MLCFDTIAAPCPHRLGDPLTSDEVATASGRVRAPKYWGVKQRLLRMLDTLPPGTAIPTERSLAMEFGASRTTVRQALADLTVEGRVRRVQGSGTFVAEPKVAQPLQLSSYTEDMQAQGKTPSSRLLAIDDIPADTELAERLGMRRGETVLRVRRLRLADDEPMAVEITHLANFRYPGLRRYLRAGKSLYQTLRDRYQVELGHAEETIETALAGPDEAHALGADIGMPMLLLSRHSFDTHGTPVEWVRSVYRGDRYKFVATLNRPPR
jgi:GntR family transcriptional regulator|uniref:GntR family transcriptional regulator n=1 Tax=Thermocrispum agreste TaxID=37925 RepID=A0A2W4JJ24_9PSEU|nr:MAG: GntR family transcriptional regulator [Thermocrispum agreste]